MMVWYTAGQEQVCVTASGAGVYNDGHDDYYEYGGMSAEEIAADLPAELDEAFGISEMVAEYQAEEAENE